MTSDKAPRRIYTNKKLIICEGKMDRLIVKRLIEARSISFNFDLFDAGSKDNIHFLISEAAASDITKYILVIADNDDKPDVAFRNIQNQIKKGGGTPPKYPKQLSRKLLPLDILMLPDTNKIGAVEWMALEVFKRDMDNTLCVDEFVKCLTKIGDWKPQQKDKLSLAAYVAGSKEKQPDISIADYFGNGVKDIPYFYKDPIFNDLANYLIAFSKV